MSHLVPMKLKPAQIHYARNRTHRDIVVKARQVYFSTGALALNMHSAFTNPYTKVTLIAHKGDSAAILLQTAHRFYNNLPKEMQPEKDWSSASWMKFPILDSFIHIDSAESKEIGRSETGNYAHLSEVAFYPSGRAKELYAGLDGSIPKGGFILLESTPRGRGGFFYDMYHAAKEGRNGYKPFFYPWWYEPDYFLPLEEPITLTEEEKNLVDTFKLTKEQINWRRYKISLLNELFFQEYPENDIDCWIMSDVAVFDGVAIREALRRIQEPVLIENNLLIWKRPIGGLRYIIGVDVGAGLPQSDPSVAVVLNSRTCEHVATLRGRIPTDLFAEQIMRLGRQYNDALLAVERNNHGHTVLQTILQSSYPNIYRHRDYHESLTPVLDQPGWVTSGLTRPIMIDTFGTALKSGDFITYSKNLLNEASSFIYVSQTGKQDKPQAAPGQTDDELMAAMIALAVRQSAPIRPVKRYEPVDYVR